MEGGVNRIFGTVHFQHLAQRTALARETIQTQPMTPAEFTSFMTAQVSKWTPTIKAMKAKPKPK